MSRTVGDFGDQAAMSAEIQSQEIVFLKHLQHLYQALRGSVDIQVATPSCFCRSSLELSKWGMYPP